MGENVSSNDDSAQSGDDATVQTSDLCESSGKEASDSEVWHTSMDGDMTSLKDV